MSSAIQVYSGQDFSVRTMQDADGTVWFVGKDVAQSLEYSESSLDSLNKLFAPVPECWKGRKRFLTPGGEQEMLCLTEQGVYFFLGRSDKRKALPYQMWIAGDVVPSIRHAGSYSVAQTKAMLIDPMQGAKVVFDAAGITGNQLALALDRLYETYTGQSALKGGDVNLTVASQNQFLTPTQIGRELGLSPRQVNRKLAYAGLQRKVADKWEPTQNGKRYAVMQDVGKWHGGTPVSQLKWDSEILDVLRRTGNE